MPMLPIAQMRIGPYQTRVFSHQRRWQDFFFDISLDKIYASPYTRAYETVAPISKAKDLDIIVDQKLRERALATGSVEDFQGTVSRYWTDEDFALEGGESNHTARKRGVAFMDRLLDSEDQAILVGTHGNIMCLIMGHYDPSIGYDFWQKLEMPDCYKLTFEGKILIAIEHLKKAIDD